MKKCTLIFLLVAAGEVSANEKDTLAQSIEVAGTHAFDDERRSVKIDGCRMTTYRWRNRPGHGWVLWTSFRFDMADAMLNEDQRYPGKKYAWTLMKTDNPNSGFALIGFTMRPGTLTRQERSVLRPTSSDAKPSLRGDGTTHYFEWRKDMLITMQGPGLEEKVRTFTINYDRYVADFCGPETS